MQYIVDSGSALVYLGHNGRSLPLREGLRVRVAAEQTSLEQKIYALGLSLRKVAARIGISHSSLWQYLNGGKQPSGANLLKLADFTGLPPKAILQDIEAIAARSRKARNGRAS